MRKKIAVPVAIVALAAAGLVAWHWWSKSEDRAAIAALRLDQTVIPEDRAADPATPSPPPPGPTNPKQLAALIAAIVELDLPECRGLKETKPDSTSAKDLGPTFSPCLARLKSESRRLAEIRDPKLAPNLIEIAKKRTLDYEPPPPAWSEAHKLFRHQAICRARMSAIEALGELGDPQAIEPLSEFVVESPPMGKDYQNAVKGCLVFDFDAVGLQTPCLSAAQALKHFQAQVDPEKSASLLKRLDSLPASARHDRDKQPLVDSLVPACKYKVWSLLGPDEFEALLLKYKDPDLSKDIQLSLSQTIEKISDPAALPHLKELVKSGDEYMFQAAIIAMGNIKDPAPIAELLTLLESSDRRIVGCAGMALKNLGPLAKAAVPALCKKLESCEEHHCQGFAETLGAIGDESALPSMFKFAITHPDDDGLFTVVAMRYINSEATIDFLKRVLANEGRQTDDMKKVEGYKKLRHAAAKSFFILRQGQDLTELCKYKDDPELEHTLSRYCASGEGEGK